MRCARCGATRETVRLWAGFAHVPNADVVCCLVNDADLAPGATD